MFRKLRKFVRVYVNNIVINFNTQKKHKTYFRNMFIVLQNNNLFIKSTKIFLKYFTVQLLNQKINFFKLVTFKNKFKTIFKLHFLRIFQQLKTYLNFIN